MLRFKCKDIGLECPFETSAPSKDYLMMKIKKHARNTHHMTEISKDDEEKIESAITGH